MTWQDCLFVSVSSLRRNTLRTVLALSGLAMGVGAVLATIALGTGAQTSIEQQVKAAGLNVIIVTAGNYRRAETVDGGVVDHQAMNGPQPDWDRAVIDPPQLMPASWHPEDNPMEKHNHPTARQRLGDSAAGLGASATLTQEDAEAIRRTVRGVQYVASGVHENARVGAGDKRWFTRLHGTDVDLPSARRAMAFPHGRFFNAQELRGAEQVVVLGNVVSAKLFGEGVDPVGREVRLWNQPFTVVGVTASSNWMVQGAPGDDQFDAVYTPFSTVHRLLNLSKLNTITITAESSGDVSRISKEVSDLLRQRHQIAETAPDDFTVRTQARDALTKGLHPNVARAVAGNVPGLESVTLEQLSGTLERASWTMTLLLSCIAIVSLVVGGIGISNIMLLAVTERTREIGVRLASGARERDVKNQFLAEAIALGIAGGAVGIVVGIIATLAFRFGLGWSTSLSPWIIATSFSVALAIGVGAGFYPAQKAARLDPIDALRYE